jgi:hypothetical protein
MMFFLFVCLFGLTFEFVNVVLWITTPDKTPVIGVISIEEERPEE